MKQRILPFLIIKIYALSKEVEFNENKKKFYFYKKIQK